MSPYGYGKMVHQCLIYVDEQVIIDLWTRVIFCIWSNPSIWGYLVQTASNLKKHMKNKKSKFILKILSFTGNPGLSIDAVVISDCVIIRILYYILESIDQR